MRAEDPGTEGVFYNYGWWDFAFEDLTYAHDRRPIAAASPHDLPAVRHFDDVGWVAIQRHIDDPSRHLQFLFKSSPYGSLSHSHADQNAFLLRAYGEDLAIQSGYYVAFGSTMHRNWRRQTRSKNAVLIDGTGQYAGRDKTTAKNAVGRLVDVREAPAPCSSAAMRPPPTELAIPPFSSFSATSMLSAIATSSSSIASSLRKPARYSGCSMPSTRWSSARRPSACEAIAPASTGISC